MLILENGIKQNGLSLKGFPSVSRLKATERAMRYKSTNKFEKKKNILAGNFYASEAERLSDMTEPPFHEADEKVRNH